MISTHSCSVLGIQARITFGYRNVVMPQELLHLINTGAVIDQKTRIIIGKSLNSNRIYPHTFSGFKKVICMLV
jgi:hypothetical protein